MKPELEKQKILTYIDRLTSLIDQQNFWHDRRIDCLYKGDYEKARVIEQQYIEVLEKKIVRTVEASLIDLGYG